MLGGGNIVELLGLNKVKKGSTAKPTFPPPDFFREYFSKKSGGTGPRHPDFLEKYSEKSCGGGNVGLAVEPFLTMFRPNSSAILWLSNMFYPSSLSRTEKTKKQKLQIFLEISEICDSTKGMLHEFRDLA